MLKQRCWDLYLCVPAYQPWAFWGNLRGCEFEEGLGEQTGGLMAATLGETEAETPQVREPQTLPLCPRA